MKTLIIKLTICLLLFNLKGLSQTVFPDYVDGELYVKIKDGVALPTSNTSKISAEREIPSIQRTIQRFTTIEKVERSFYFTTSEKLKNVYKIKIKKPELVDEILKEIQKDEGVEYVEKIPLFKTETVIPNDFYFSLSGGGITYTQWHLQKINATSAWAIQTGSSSIVVAVVDNAIKTDHPDLAANLIQGRDVSDNDNNTNPPNTLSTFSHGTGVAGCVSTINNNNTGLASIGGYAIKVMPIKVTRDTEPNPRIVNDPYDGVAWAANNGAKIINCSWAGSAINQTQINVINNALSQGCIIIAAAGNDNVSTLSYPAALNGVIAVGSTDIADSKSSFSNYGNWVDISAPGTNITVLSTSTFGYNVVDGTSFSAPITSGLVALLLSQNPTWTAAQVEAKLKSSADNIDAQNPSYVGQLGAGRINAAAALSNYCVKDLYTSGCSTNNDGIKSVTVKGVSLSSTSDCSVGGRYSFYKNQNNINVFSGETCNFSIDLLSNTRPEHFVIWLDANRNNQFETSERVFVTSTPQTGTVISSFNVPCNISAGALNMRIRVRHNNSNIDACSTYDFGEVEDYVLNVVAPPVPSVSVSPSSICFGSSATLSATGCTGTVNWSNGSTGSSVSFTPAAGSFTYTATCTLNGCVSASSSPTNTLTVNSVPPQPNNYTTSSSAVCPGQNNVTYTIPAVAGATSYNWSYTGTGHTINGSGTSVTINFSNTVTPGTLSVIANNACGSSTARTLVVTVSQFNQVISQLQQPQSVKDQIM
jgi:subtilisin family serine protease